MVKRLALVTVVALGVGWLLTPPRLAEQRVTVTPFSVVVEPVEPIPIVHKDRIILPNNMMCPQWAQIAIDTGWQEEDLAMLDHIIHRESRCYSAVHYSQDPNGGSYGLMQVNAYWCKPSDWYPNGYLQAFGVLDNCEQLFEPRINLLSARL
ncbi:MAG: hypothetical protein EB050_08175, partial [Actinobacteria bacterium]|nr:hypothetical protein [Actinomycetota bacterium]